MGHAPSEPPAAAPSPATPGRLTRLIKKIWWFHSFFALFFGVGVMLFARHGLAYADKLLMVLGLSWLLMFVALRFIVGPANRSENEKLIKKGVRLGTNYVIKQLYQQMFFFLVPLYASSATWSLSSFNWWMAPILLACAVVSTLDLVFDNVIMERRLLASSMYGLAMFGLLNVILPLAFGVTHLEGLLVAACATPIAVALLSFSARAVFAPQGLVITIAVTLGLFAAVAYGRRVIPPAPLSMSETAVGHGGYGTYECLPASKHVIRRTQLDGLRCGSLLVEPGGIKEEVVHVWKHDRRVVARVTPIKLTCDGDGQVFRSELPPALMPADPEGNWQCVTETVGGQLVGVRKFQIVGADGKVREPGAKGPEDDAGAGDDGGTGADGGAGDGGVGARDGGAGARDGGAGPHDGGTPPGRDGAPADAPTR
ncbi:MAG TPA: DUF5924 family protein [Kofleriaceae bacterium]|nr:DUF5924 family protein [Kofleriaceae bacterium]